MVGLLSLIADHYEKPSWLSVSYHYHLVFCLLSTIWFAILHLVGWPVITKHGTPGSWAKRWPTGDKMAQESRQVHGPSVATSLADIFFARASLKRAGVKRHNPPPKKKKKTRKNTHIHAIGYNFIKCRLVLARHLKEFTPNASWWSIGLERRKGSPHKNQNCKQWGGLWGDSWCWHETRKDKRIWAPLIAEGWKKMTLVARSR